MDLRLDRRSGKPFLRERLAVHTFRCGWSRCSRTTRRNAFARWQHSAAVSDGKCGQAVSGVAPENRST
jgi:hypothetical protein